MDTDRVDRLSRAAASVLPRRTASAIFGLGALTLSGLVDAGKKRKKKRHKKVKLNEFGCVNVGGFCKNDGQCCSGICDGKKDKKTCRAHTTDICRAGQTNAVCGGVNETCTNTDGGDGTCSTTTGNAPYCLGAGNCFPCARDADCVPFCGPEAACIPCAAFCPMEGTLCAGASIIDGCEFPT